MNGSLRVPRDVFAELTRFEQALDRILPRPQSPGSIRASARGEFPAVNVGSTPDTIEIVAFAPSIDPKSVELSIDRGLMIIAGERAPSIPVADERISVYAQERYVGPFRRVISLPEDADPARVNATYRDGFLRITVSKRESSKPRRIQVRAEGGQS